MLILVDDGMSTDNLFQIENNIFSQSYFKLALWNYHEMGLLMLIDIS